jgi:hypothetical protein
MSLEHYKLQQGFRCRSMTATSGHLQQVLCDQSALAGITRDINLNETRTARHSGLIELYVHGR